MKEGKVFDCDVLIIGGGAAGARAAIESADLGADVILLDKGVFGHSGASGKHSGWGLASSFMGVQGDNADIHFRDTLRGGGFLGNRKLIKILVSEAKVRILELERYGCLIWRSERGWPVIYGPLGGHSRPRSMLTTANMWTIAYEVLRRGVRVFEETMVTRLLKYDQSVVGAVCINKRTGLLYIFRAKSVVLATGGAGQLFGWEKVRALSSNPVEITGDGYSMSYQAGAELVDMEFIQFIPWEGGWSKDYFHDKDGIAWLKPIPSREMTRARLTKEIIMRIREGKGTEHGGIWFDPTFYKDKYESLIGYPYQDYRLIELEKEGRDLTKWIEVYPYQHHCMGGVVINQRCETTIPGLYACGEVAGGVQGANRLGTNAFSDTIVFGKRAGEYATKRALKIEKPKIDWKQVENEYIRVFDVLKRSAAERVRVHEIRHKLQKLMWDVAGPVRDAKGLMRGLEEIDGMRERDLPKMYVTSMSRVYNRDWIEALELYNMLDSAEMILRAAYVRTESRQAQQRLDYPEANDSNWLANIYIKLVKGKAELEKRLVT